MVSLKRKRIFLNSAVYGQMRAGVARQDYAFPLLAPGIGLASPASRLRLVPKYPGISVTSAPSSKISQMIIAFRAPGRQALPGSRNDTAARRRAGAGGNGEAEPG